METKQKKNPRPSAQKPQPGKVSPAKSKTERKVQNPARKREKAQKTVKATPDVVYLPPKPFSRNRLILHLATVAAVVLALVLGLSIFFKVDADKIIVSGTDKYTAWDVASNSGIEDGDNLLTFSRGQAAGRIKNALKYVKDVRIGIKLPDTVYIDIVEVEVTYAVRSGDVWWLVSADGRIIEQGSGKALENATKILGVQLSNPKEGAQAAALQEPQTATDSEGNLVPVTVTAADRLRAALDIAGFLESNGIIGKAASIDVNDMGGIQLWYGSQYQVELGDRNALALKISALKSALDQYLKNHDSGILDITDPKQVLYTSF